MLHWKNTYTRIWTMTYLPDQHIMWSLWSPCTGQKENWKNIKFLLDPFQIPKKTRSELIRCIGVNHAHNGRYITQYVLTIHAPPNAWVKSGDKVTQLEIEILPSQWGETTFTQEAQFSCFREGESFFGEVFWNLTFSNVLHMVPSCSHKCPLGYLLYS